MEAKVLPCGTLVSFAQALLCFFARLEYPWQPKLALACAALCRLRMQRLRRLARAKGLPDGSSLQDQKLQGEGLPADVMGAAEEALGLPSQQQQQQHQHQQLMLPRKKRVIDTMRELGSALGLVSCL